VKELAYRSSNQSYLSLLRRLVRPNEQQNGVVIDLFAGCGGLSLGFEAAGFKTIGYEKEKIYAKTYNSNLSGECIVEMIDSSTEYPSADVVIGGPPCQPWSETGKNLGSNDERDGFPAFINCVKQVKPKLFIAENVKGLSFKKNNSYLKHIISQFEDLGYSVDSQVLRMSNYGVPQNRERLFIIGRKGKFLFPSHHEKVFSVRDALGRMATSHVSKGARYLTPAEDKYIQSYEKKCQLKNSRNLHLDQPSRTLTCRNLAGSTSDMIRLLMADGRRRKLRVKEAARLQGFPDWFEFSGNEKQAFYQIGQSVPPLFSYQLALSVIEYIQKIDDCAIEAI
jgi:DNA (cytosine-5)-methyltransferase 1